MKNVVLDLLSERSERDEKTKVLLHRSLILDMTYGLIPSSTIRATRMTQTNMLKEI